MKLEVGKYYRSREGAKRGPVEDRGYYLAASGWHYRSDGSHLYADPEQDLVAEWKDITMDGKYAYRKDPYTQVRILCVDRPGDWDNVVISMDEFGTTRGHRDTGVYDSGINPDWDLIPLQEKLPDLWVNIYSDGKVYTHTDEGVAKRSRGSSPNGKTVKYIPAPYQTS